MVLSITNLQNKIYQHSFPIAPVFLTFLLHRYQRATKQAKAFPKVNSPIASVAVRGSLLTS